MTFGQTSVSMMTPSVGRVDGKLLDGVGRVVREVALMDAFGRKRHELFTRFAPRGRHVGEQHVALGPVGEHALQERLGRVGFTHAHGVDPNARSSPRRG